MKKNSSLARVLRKFRRQTIAVLGDFMLDEVLRGEATRLSPEAPVPIVLMDGNQAPASYPGGAGNVLANIVALGGHGIPFGTIGGDESGARLRKLLAAQGIPCHTLLVERDRITPRKLRIAAHQQQLLRLDFEKPRPITPAAADRLVRAFARSVPRIDALIISDYRKGTAATKLCAEVTSLARQHRVPILVDPKPEHPEICRHATIATPNLREAEVMAGFTMRDPSRLRAGGQRLLAELNCSFLLITRGADGMTLFEKDGRIYNIPGIPRPVYDVTGAGDTVIATLAIACAAGASMMEAAELANRAAGCVVLKFGTSVVSAAELSDALPPAH